jgi:hypothetical protein
LRRRRALRCRNCAAILGLIALCGAGDLLKQDVECCRDEREGSVNDLVNWVKIQFGIETRESLADQALIRYGRFDPSGKFGPPPMARFPDPSDPDRNENAEAVHNDAAARMDRRRLRASPSAKNVRCVFLLGTNASVTRHRHWESRIAP